MASFASNDLSSPFRAGRWVQAAAPAQTSPQAPWRRGRAYAEWLQEVPPLDVQRVLLPHSGQQAASCSQARGRRPASASAIMCGRKAELARKESLMAFAMVKSAARTTACGAAPEALGLEDAAELVPEACQNPTLQAAFLASYDQMGREFLAGTDSNASKLGYAFVGHHTDIAVNKATGHYVKLLTPREASLHQQVLRQRSDALLRELRDDPAYYGHASNGNGNILGDDVETEADATTEPNAQYDGVDWGVDLRFVARPDVTSSKPSRSLSSNAFGNRRVSQGTSASRRKHAAQGSSQCRGRRAAAK